MNQIISQCFGFVNVFLYLALSILAGKPDNFDFILGDDLQKNISRKYHDKQVIEPIFSGEQNSVTSVTCMNDVA